MLTIEVPEYVARLYNQWRQRHQRMGRIPARAECGRDEDGNELWCSLPNASTDLLKEVHQYHLGEVRALLDRYRSKPGQKLARDIVRHMTICDASEELAENALPAECGEEAAGGEGDAV
jgi:hypothetical protein